MIDTIGFFYEVNRLDVEVIKKKCKPHRNKKGELTWGSNLIDNGFTYNYIPKRNHLYIIVNPKKVLNKHNIINEDYSLLVKKIEASVSKVLFNKIKLEDLHLRRVDFKKDIITEYKYIYIEILKKLSDQYRRKRKRIYPTSVYYKGRSYNLNFYDKEQEVKEKNKFNELEEYKNTLRLEIQIKRPYLKNYLKKHGLEITLSNFFDSKMRLILFIDITQKLLYKGDYFTIEENRKTLSNNYSENMTEKLISFQELIHKYGVTNTKRNINKNTWGRYILRLEDIKINPITIKEVGNLKKLPNLISYIEE